MTNTFWSDRLLPPMTPLIDDDPAEVGGFKLAGRIGSGRQAVVYFGVGAAGETTAVKLLHADRQKEDRALRAFDGEERALTLSPDSMSPRLYRAGWDRGRRFLAMEHVQGLSLEELIRRHGPLVGPDLTRFAIRAATTVSMLHDLRIHHGDIKPRHVITGPGGRLFLIDFGIAKIGDRLLRRRDLFNLAAVLLFAAGGSFPYEGTPLEISSRTMTGRADVGGLPEAWRAVLASCLDPNRRRCPGATRVLKTLNRSAGGA